MRGGRHGSAHGKVILFGEHAVVYGVPALAVGIDRGAVAEARVIDAPEAANTLHVREWNITVSDDAALASEPSPLACAFREALEATRRDFVTLGSEPLPRTHHVEASTDLPPGGGLGCSAALGVAVVRALDPNATPEDVASRVNAWERVFHGNPSGIDAAVAAQGGCILFQRSLVALEKTPSEKASPTTTSSSGASLERVRVSQPLSLCIGHTGHASSTKTMVDAVARVRERRPDVTKRTFDAIHTLVRNARLAIEAHDLKAVGQLLDLNQMLLSGLFVSTPEIEQMCGTARSSGALGAKLTGAGGGGCVVALVDGAERGGDVLTAWKREGFDGFFATVKPAMTTDVHAVLAKLHARAVAADSP